MSENTEELKMLISSLSEELSSLEELKAQVHQLIQDVKTLKSREYNPELSRIPGIPLSDEVMAKIESKAYSTSDLDDQLKNKIEHVADMILKYGKNIDYISMR